MGQVCTWCHKKLSREERQDLEKGVIAGCVCEPCAGRVRPGTGRSLNEFLDSLGVPVLLIDSEPKVYTANIHAQNLLGKELHQIEGRKGGDVFECAYAKRPGGCGEQEHCRSCTIRRTVLDTFSTGHSHRNVRAYPDLQLGQSVKTMCVEISTEKLGQCVLLRVDELCDKPEA